MLPAFFIVQYQHDTLFFVFHANAASRTKVLGASPYISHRIAYVCVLSLQVFFLLQIFLDLKERKCWQFITAIF